MSLRTLQAWVQVMPLHATLSPPAMNLLVEVGPARLLTLPPKSLESLHFSSLAYACSTWSKYWLSLLFSLLLSPAGYSPPGSQRELVLKRKPDLLISLPKPVMFRSTVSGRKAKIYGIHQFL